MNNGKNYSRREFMTKPLAYMAAAGGLQASLELLEAAVTANVPVSGKLPERRLGNTGLKLPIVSMGALNADIPALPFRAYDLGVRHFDTAGVYQGGRNEEMLGNFVKARGVRDKVAIGTKVLLAPEVFEGGSAALKARFLKEFEGSLRRLQMDYVDILYLHAVSTATEVNNAAVQDVLAELKKQGKVRFSGVSAHGGPVEVLNAVMQTGAYDVVLLGFNYTKAGDKVLLETINRAVAKGIGLIAMKTQMGGEWPKPSDLSMRVPDNVRQAAALKWVLRNQAITTAVPGAKTFAQVDFDCSVGLNLDFTPEEARFLTEKDLRASLEFCQQCGECVPTCPYRVDIPTLMRTHMYALQYGNREHARFTLAQVPRGKGLDVCRACPSCNAACADVVNITRRISELKTVGLA